MTQTLTADGRPLYFPTSMTADASGMLLPTPSSELAVIAQAAAADGLLLFTKRLVDGARKRRFTPRWREVNRDRLKLARLCIDRVLQEQLV